MDKQPDLKQEEMLNLLDVFNLLQHGERERASKGVQRLPRPDRPTIHYTELPQDTSGNPGARAWNFYRQQVGRLLAEGHEGRWVLIKDEEILGIRDTDAEVRAIAVKDYLMQPVLIRQILVREPVLRGPSLLYRCRN